MGRHLTVPPDYYNLKNIYNFGLKRAPSFEMLVKINIRLCWIYSVLSVDNLFINNMSITLLMNQNLLSIKKYN